MTDLGVIGGSFSTAIWVNELGDVAGLSTVDGDVALHGFIWKDGKMIDLETVPGDNNSSATYVNDFGQAVGESWTFDGTNTTAVHAYLWENGEGVDLNLLVSNHTDLYLTEANYVTDRGEIIANGVLPNGDLRAAVLLPEPEFCQPFINAGPPRKYGPLQRKTIDGWRRHPRQANKFAPAFQRP